MPGLVGFVREAAGETPPETTLAAMRQLMTHCSFYQQDALWSDGVIYASRVTTGVYQRAPQPHQRDGHYLWLDGILHNRDEMAAHAGLRDARDDADLLLALYAATGTFDFLKHVDGHFAAVLYDAENGRLHLITDRYGMRALYWTVHRGGLVWGSEVKVVLALPGYQPRIDRQTAREYAFVSHPMGDRTWFEGVQLLSTGSVLTWDIAARTHALCRYWWWDAIRPADRVPDVREAAEEAGRLFIRSVEQHCPDTRVNVELSGGLDSRAILAAIPASKEVHAYTSGQRECDDIRIARRVSQLRGAAHHVYEIDRMNWLSEETLADIWRMDGQASLRIVAGARTHGPGLLDARVRLNGLGGDIVVRGHSLRYPHELDTPITEPIVRLHLKYPEFQFDSNAYSGLNRIEYFFFDTRVRRFAGGTARSTLVYGEVRFPFLNNRLVEFLYSLPDRLRYQGRLYRIMLTMFFPAYFETIPWQHTGVPVNFPSPVERARRLPAKTWRVFWKYARKAGLTAYKNNNPRYTLLNRPLWLRQEPVRSFVESLLRNRDAIYPDYISRSFALAMWERHQRGEDFANRLCNVLTAEIWLQQVFTGQFRPESQRGALTERL